MRINVLALSYLFPNRAQPGYGIFVLNRLAAVRQYCNIKVIAPIQWYPFMRVLRGALWGASIPREEAIEGFEVHHPRFAVVPRYLKWFDAISFFWSARAVAERLRKKAAFDFDLVDVHWTYPDIVAAYYLARSRGKKFIVTVRGHEALYLNENTVRRRLVAHFLRKADAVVALSAELRDAVVKLGVKEQNVRVILNGVDLSQFQHMDRNECRRRLNLHPDKKILLSVGRLTEGKGHQELIRALPELLKVHDVELHIIGGVNPEDDYQHVLRKMIAERGLANVHFIDKVNHQELSQWYGAADAFCLATKSEGCPNVVLEALACGTPVVVARVGAVDELVHPGENGYLVARDDLQAWGPTIRRALETQWDRKAIAAGMQRWGWARCGEQVQELYRSVLSEAHMRGAP